MSETGVSVNADSGAGTTRVDISSGKTGGSGSVLPAGNHDGVSRGTLQHTIGGEVTTTGNENRALSRFSQPGTIELIPGLEASRTSIKAAVAMGAARVLPDGSVVLVEGQPEQEQAPEQHQAASTADQFVTEADQQELGQSLSEFPEVNQQALDSVLPIAAMHLADSGDLSGVATRLAQATGMDPADAARAIERAAPVFQKGIERVLAAAGIDTSEADSFYAWAREPKQRGQFNSALIESFTTGGTGALRQLAQQYDVLTTPSESDLVGMGYKTARAADGSLGVQIEGKWYEVSDLRMPPRR